MLTSCAVGNNEVGPATEATDCPFTYTFITAELPSKVAATCCQRPLGLTEVGNGVETPAALRTKNRYAGLDRKSVCTSKAYSSPPAPAPLATMPAPLAWAGGPLTQATRENESLLEKFKVGLSA